jgi:hypothetical protein
MVPEKRALNQFRNHSLTDHLKIFSDSLPGFLRDPDAAKGEENSPCPGR